MNHREHGNGRCQQDVRLTLLDGFNITVEKQPIALPLSSQRVLVALALHRGDKDRAVLGSMLYPDGRRNQISASLRSALWRAQRNAARTLVETSGQRLRLAEDVEVDLWSWAARARVLTSLPRTDPVADCPEMIEALSRQLLPSWGDEWLVLERQRWDHLRLHALEQLTDSLAAEGRHLDALEAGLAAVAIEPYRETAHRALIRTYIAEGNCASALAQYRRYHRLLISELGVRPTAQLQALVQNITGE
jgi:DNA-binding SARP family transcriptional activator